MSQMQTLSIRLPDEDFQWLLSTSNLNGRTPSEKLRSLISRARQDESGMSDPEVCASWLRGLTQPLTSAVSAWERKQKKHSELVSATLEATPALMALQISWPLDEESDLARDTDILELEAELARQAFRLLTNLLRISVTTSPAVYDSDSIEHYLPSIVEIAEIISNRKEKEQKNG